METSELSEFVIIGVEVEKARACKHPIDMAGRRAANEMNWKIFRQE